VYVVEMCSWFVWSSRCFAALGDVSKARYLHETNRVAEEAAKTMVNKLVHNVLSSISVAEYSLILVLISKWAWIATQSWLLIMFSSCVEMFRAVMALAITRWGHAWQSWRRTSNLLKVFIWSRFVCLLLTYLVLLWYWYTKFDKGNI